MNAGIPVLCNHMLHLNLYAYCSGSTPSKTYFIFRTLLIVIIVILSENVFIVYTLYRKCILVIF